MPNNAPVAEVDPWLQDEHGFGQVDFAAHADDNLLASATAIANEPTNSNDPFLDGLDSLAGIPDEAPPQPEPVAEVPAADEPQVIDLQDGSKVTIEQTKRGLKATLESATGAKPEIFYGKDQTELMQNVLVGKLNATKKIHELNTKVKQSVQLSADPVPQAPPAGAVENELTADQRFEVKTAMDAGDMAKAMELTFRYKYGRDLKDLVTGADSGRVAKAELDTEGVARAFRAANPDYYNTNENYHRVLRWLTDRTDGPRLAANLSNVDQVFTHITNGGYWTVENLQRAYNELSQEPDWDVLPASETEEEVEEDTPEVPAVPVRRAAAPPAKSAPQSERIVRTVRRPRAGLGIRPAAASSGGAADTVNVSAPSVDELDNLSDAEFNRLYQETLRTARRQSARR